MWRYLEQEGEGQGKSSLPSSHIATCECQENYFFVWLGATLLEPDFCQARHSIYDLSFFYSKLISFGHPRLRNVERMRKS